MEHEYLLKKSRNRVSTKDEKELLKSENEYDHSNSSRSESSDDEMNQNSFAIDMETELEYKRLNSRNNKRNSGQPKELPISKMKTFSTTYESDYTSKQRRNRGKHGKRLGGQRKLSVSFTEDCERSLRVSAYCTCDKVDVFGWLKWLQKDAAQVPGSELHGNGWCHQMYLGAVHSICTSPKTLSGKHENDGNVFKQKDVFYFATGCVVFWGLTHIEEKAHLKALTKFSIAPVKQIQFEDMEFTYGPEWRIRNDQITLKSENPAEKLAFSFAMATSSKLDVFEKQVEETIEETNHIPEDLASTGSIRYSKTDISKLIGRLFIVRTDVNLNSDMLDSPDYFWEEDEFEPLYSKMMRYLDVAHRVTVLNTRLDVLRELLDVLNQQLENQHASHLEWIIIWLILAEVAVQVIWNMLIKDVLGFFPNSISN